MSAYLCLGCDEFKELRRANAALTERVKELGADAAQQAHWKFAQFQRAERAESALKELEARHEKLLSECERILPKAEHQVDRIPVLESALADRDARIGALTEALKECAGWLEEVKTGEDFEVECWSAAGRARALLASGEVSDG